MKKFISLLLLIFPVITLAADSLSFAPPIGDSSVVFLENLFGVVDGVLHGTGSQIMGSMFAVFNAAVLALGGIVIMYTLIIGTMNTAQEGEMLGHKWSSIWIPIRTTVGLALLVPKASGYCLIQIFVMWTVVQGVGAADKVWAAALSYLNRGGVIIHEQMNPVISESVDNSNIARGATVILDGQVCMVGLQKLLENQRQGLMNAKDKQAGACSGKPSGAMADFCSNAVPDFLNTVNVVYVQGQNPTSSSPYSVPMPNFDSGSTYSSLNGICGTISWNPLKSTSVDDVSKYIPNVKGEDLSTTILSRAIAIQQMYVDLSLVARSMVNNDPQINGTDNSSTSNNFSAVATSQFGVPNLKSGTPCGKQREANCTRWGADITSNTAPLMNGTEFQGAIADYNGIMQPALNLISQANDKSKAADARKFINDANNQGWLLAGSYFFDLVKLNGLATGQTATDKSSGLDGSNFSTDTLLSPFDSSGSCTSSYPLLCELFGKDSTKIEQLVALIDGSGLVSKAISPPANVDSAQGVYGVGSSTTNGYINNALMVYLPNQPGMEPPSLGIFINVKPIGKIEMWKKRGFSCGTIMNLGCLGRNMRAWFYNDLFLNVIKIFTDLMNDAFNYVILNFLTYPMQEISRIFERGVARIEKPGVNPILALAQMGSYYINEAMSLWIKLLGLSILLGWTAGLGGILLSFITPFLYTWTSIMVGIGYITAYYVPFLPFMIFTFGTMAWLIAVIEAMVAAPIVALGITHPEGEGILGKGEQAIMLLMNVFLRPAMMIIGYIAGIALCYVSVWIINAGFGHFNSFMRGKGSESLLGYVNYASMFAGFFSMLVYTMMYLTVVQKAFTLIYVLPDKVLRWIGGQQEQLGQDIAQWSEESKGQIKEAGTETAKAGATMGSRMKGRADQAGGMAKEGIKKGLGYGGGGGGKP